MDQINPFVREDDVPSWFLNAIQFALSVLASQLKVLKADNTHVTVPAGVDDLAAVVSIEGRWRWNEAPVTVAHPGGATGLYPLFVTAAAQSITSVPAPLTDHTTYSFGVEIDAPGAHPSTALYRHVADVAWDGTKITRVSQLVPASPLHASEHAIGGDDPLSPADIGAAPAADVGGKRTHSEGEWAGVIALGGGPTRMRYAGDHWSGGSDSVYTAPEAGSYLVIAQANVENAVSPTGVDLSLVLRLFQDSSVTPLVGPPIFWPHVPAQIWGGVLFSQVVDLAAGETFYMELFIGNPGLATTPATASLFGAPVSVVRVA